MTADCPVYSQELEKLENDLRVQMFFSKFISDLEYIKNHTNLELGVKAISWSITLYYALIIEVSTYLILHFVNYSKYTIYILFPSDVLLDFDDLRIRTFYIIYNSNL